MFATLTRIFRSLFSMPIWVIVWMCVFLIPANLSGFLFLEYASGVWVVLLGAGALAINTVILLLNGGFSKALAIPHLLLWGPLQVILLYRLLVAPDIDAAETTYILAILIVNGISLGFDIFDTIAWKRGNRDVEGFPGEPVRF